VLRETKSEKNEPAVCEIDAMVWCDVGLNYITRTAQMFSHQSATRDVGIGVSAACCLGKVIGWRVGRVIGRHVGRVTGRDGTAVMCVLCVLDGGGFG
jgi:hypothetical protein